MIKASLILGIASITSFMLGLFVYDNLVLISGLLGFIGIPFGIISIMKHKKWIGFALCLASLVLAIVVLGILASNM